MWWLDLSLKSRNAAATNPLAVRLGAHSANPVENRAVTLDVRVQAQVQVQDQDQEGPPPAHPDAGTNLLAARRHHAASRNARTHRFAAANSR